MTETVTPRQAEMLAFIRAFRADHGYSPTVAEIARHFKMVDNGAKDHLNALEKKGLLTTRKKTARSIVLTEDVDLVAMVPRMVTCLLSMRNLLDSIMFRLRSDELVAVKTEIREATLLIDRVIRTWK